MYMAAFKLNPFGPQAPTAKKALMDLAARQAQLDHPNDGPELTARTLQMIERQAGDMKRMKIGEANMQAQWKNKSGQSASVCTGLSAAYHHTECARRLHPRVLCSTTEHHVHS